MESDSVELSDSTLDPSTNTKRSILSQISKVFDPLGLFLPVTTKGKILMRELWSLKLSWDEPVPENLQREWSKHCSDLSQLSSIPLPRSCANQDSNETGSRSPCMRPRSDPPNFGPIPKRIGW